MFCLAKSFILIWAINFNYYYKFSLTFASARFEPAPVKAFPFLHFIIMAVSELGPRLWLVA